MATSKAWEAIVHFKPAEFDSPDEPGSGLGMNMELIQMLETLRKKVGFPIKINSGYRTAAENLKAGGVSESAHTTGKAVDIQCSTGGERYAILKAAFEMSFRRIGIGNTFIHLDIDPDKPQSVVWLYPPKK